MSKRVLIILAAGFVLIIAGIFLLKHELSIAPPEYEPEYEEEEPEPEAEPEPEPAPVIKAKLKKVTTNEEAGTETTE